MWKYNFRMKLDLEIKSEIKIKDLNLEMYG